MSEDKFKGPFGGIDEQAVNDHLEDLVGIDRSFRLMNLARSCIQAASGNRCTFYAHRKVDPAALFRKKAKDNGYNNEAIEFYIKYFCSWS